MFLINLQRKFITGEPTQANEQGKLFTSFRDWVWDKYPNGIGEAEWRTILMHDSLHTFDAETGASQLSSPSSSPSSSCPSTPISYNSDDAPGLEDD